MRLALALLVVCAGCAADAATDAVAVGRPLPDLRFSGVDEGGRATTLSLHAALGARDLAWIVVSGGEWCGTCQYWARHADTVLPEALAARTTRLDLVVGDRDAAPATLDAAAAWQAGLSREGIPVGADPDHHFDALVVGPRRALPLHVVVDRRTREPLVVLSNPSPSALRDAMRSALAELDGTPPPAPEVPTLIDGLFHENEWELLGTVTLPEAPPPDPTNRVADSPAAAALGRALFFDAGLSESGTLSCAGCHDPERALADGLPHPEGQARRTPSIALSAHARWLFWDGRADSAWAQALAPLESPLEMASSRTAVARHVLRAHREAYEAAFGAVPDTTPWPSSGMPGDPAFDAQPAEIRDAITETFVNVGKAIAAYERTLRVGPTALDAYLAGDRDALDGLQRYGLELFVRSGCMQCHWGPRLTDDAFHVVGMPGPSGDLGRAGGVAAWRSSELRGDGRWSDAPSPRGASRVGLVGAFRTPTLRGVASAPYLGHGGAITSLPDLMSSYGDPPPSFVGEREPWVGRFGETTAWGLVPFLEVLEAPLSP